MSFLNPYLTSLASNPIIRTQIIRTKSENSEKTINIFYSFVCKKVTINVQISISPSITHHIQGSFRDNFQIQTIPHSLNKDSMATG